MGRNYRIVAAVLVSLVTASLALWPVVRLAGWRSALWVSLDLELSATATAPVVTLLVGQDREESRLPMMWDPAGSADFISLVPDHDATRVRILGVETDGRALHHDELRPDRNWDRTAPWPISAGKGVLGLPSSPLSVSIEIASDTNAEITLRWRQIEQRVSLAAGKATRVSLSAPGRTAWVMLPAWRIDRVALDFPSGTPTMPDAVKVHRGDGIRLPVADGSACQPNQPCRLELDGPLPLNALPLIPALLAWLGLLSLSVVSLSLIWRLAMALKHLDRHFAVVPTALGDVLLRSHPSWTLARVTVGVAAISITWHAFLVYVVPVTVVNDSLDYLAAARAMAEGHGLAGVPSYRTPGYIVLTALSYWLGGDQLLILHSLQQFFLAMVGPAVAWVLYGRLGSLPATACGLAAGISPRLAVAGTEVLAEPVFAVAAVMTLLALIPPLSDGPKFGRKLVAGAVMFAALCFIRPSGASLALIILAAMAVETSWRPQWRGILRLGAAALALAGAFWIAGHPLRSEQERRFGIGQAAGMMDDWFAGERGRLDHALILEPADYSTFAAWTQVMNDGRVGAVRDANAAFAAYFRGYRNGSQPHAVLQWEVLADRRFALEVPLDAMRNDPGRFLLNVGFSFYNNLILNFFTGYPVVQSNELHLVAGGAIARAALPAHPLNQKTLAQMAEPVVFWTGPQYWSNETNQRMMAYASAMTATTGLHDGTGLVRAAFKPLFLAGTIDAWVGIIALFSGLTLLALPPLRVFLPMWLYCVGVMTSLALMSYSNDRYLAILEPLLYVLACCGALGPLMWRFQRKDDRQ